MARASPGKTRTKALVSMAAASPADASLASFTNETIQAVVDDDIVLTVFPRCSSGNCSTAIQCLLLSLYRK